MFSVKKYLLLLSVGAFALSSCLKPDGVEILEGPDGMDEVVRVSVEDGPATKSFSVSPDNVKAVNWVIFPVESGSSANSWSITDYETGESVTYPLAIDSPNASILLKKNKVYDVYVLANMPASDLSDLQGYCDILSGVSGGSLSRVTLDFAFSKGGSMLYGMDAIDAFGHTPRAGVHWSYSPSSGKKINSPVPLLHEFRLSLKNMPGITMSARKVVVKGVRKEVYPFRADPVGGQRLAEAGNDIELSSYQLGQLNSGNSVSVYFPENIAGKFDISDPAERSVVNIHSIVEPDVIDGRYITYLCVDFDAMMNYQSSKYKGDLHLELPLGEPGDVSSCNIYRNTSTGLRLCLDPEKYDIEALEREEWCNIIWGDYEYVPADFQLVSGSLAGDWYTGQVIDLEFTENISSGSFVNTLANEDLSSEWLEINGKHAKLYLSRAGSHRITLKSIGNETFSKTFDVEIPRFRPSYVENRDFGVYYDASAFRMSVGGTNVLLPVDGSYVGFGFFDKSGSRLDSDLFDDDLWDNVLLKNTGNFSNTSGIVGSSGMIMYCQKVAGAENMGSKTVYFYPSWLDKYSAYSNKFKDLFKLTVKVYCPKALNNIDIENRYYLTSAKAYTAEVRLGNSRNIFRQSDISFSGIGTDVAGHSIVDKLDLALNFTFNNAFGGLFNNCKLSIRNYRSGEVFTRSFTATVYNVKGIALYHKPESDNHHYLYPVFLDYHQSNRVMFNDGYKDDNYLGRLTWDPDGPIKASYLKDVGQVDARDAFKRALTGTAMNRDYWVASITRDISTISFNGMKYHSFASGMTGYELGAYPEQVMSLNGILSGGAINTFLSSLNVSYGQKRVNWIENFNWNSFWSVSKDAYASFLVTSLPGLSLVLLAKASVCLPEENTPLSDYFGSGKAGYFDGKDYYKESGQTYVGDKYVRYYDFISNPLP